MANASPFLTARWSNLLLLTYAVPPEILEPRLGRGLELDTLDDQAFVSLVAFDFLETAVKGVKWPGFVNFPEINLRFYVREVDSGRRGVMFVREFVPSALVAWIARTLYNEPYASTKMNSRHWMDESDQAMVLEHTWQWKGQTQRLEVRSQQTTQLPVEGSTEHFFKEHQWGFGATRAGEPLVYEVQHPHWETHEVTGHTLDVDFGLLYGEEFAFLNQAEPYSVVHAVGSQIQVFPHDRS